MDFHPQHSFATKKHHCYTIIPTIKVITTWKKVVIKFDTNFNVNIQLEDKHLIISVKLFHLVRACCNHLILEKMEFIRQMTDFMSMEPASLRIAFILGFISYTEVKIIFEKNL